MFQSLPLGDYSDDHEIAFKLSAMIVSRKEQCLVWVNLSREVRYQCRHVKRHPPRAWSNQVPGRSTFSIAVM